MKANHKILRKKTKQIFENEILEEKRLSKIFPRRSKVFTREQIKFIENMEKKVLALLDEQEKEKRKK